jgi:hypothetical protein
MIVPVDELLVAYVELREGTIQQRLHSRQAAGLIAFKLSGESGANLADGKFWV